MAKKGMAHNCPKKVVQIPADVRALGSAGGAIAQSIRNHYANQAKQERKPS